MKCNNSFENSFMLSIGANLGNRERTIRKAIELLSKAEGMSISKISSLYETEPVGYAEQPWFLNIALLGETSNGVNPTIQLCKSIEYLLGRQIREKWTEREIDIDLLFFGDMIISSDMLSVPHPRMQERRFVLLPANEIAPDYKHPVLNYTISELLDNCNDNSIVRQYS